MNKFFGFVKSEKMPNEYRHGDICIPKKTMADPPMIVTNGERFLYTVNKNFGFELPK
jgi:hypothetical protein